ncbi:MAG: low temperature requirement protein A [Oscillatoriales cyanobacterium C42_A2020_001]|nr:low temperature requirement protein A [Leptolyngbyaceae cyanobacterium C42_A2020_001]
MMNWLQPPRLRVGEDNEAEPRRVTWLELFYDLVFVVAVSQLAHELSKNVSLGGFLGFVELFIPIWWAWIGTTFYANRFDTDTVVRRVLMAVQMLAIAALAVNIHHGLDESSVGFALAYAAARLVLVFEYLWAGWCILQARELATHYSIGFAIAVLFWIASVFVPLPFRLIFWVIGLAIDFATPLTGQHHQARLLPHTEHLPERFGLFTIIVLGEAVVAVVRGVSEVEWSLMNAMCAILGFAIAFSLWWLYFDNVDGSSLRVIRTSGSIGIFQVWLCVHLPLVIGIVAAGVGVEHIILSEDRLALAAADRWLMCGAIALCFVALSILHRTGVIFKCKARTKHRLAGAGALLLLAIVGENLLPLVLISIIVGICIIEVGLDLYQGRPASAQPSVPGVS